MIKKIFLSLLVILLFQTGSYASDWEKVSTFNHKEVYVDNQSVRLEYPKIYYVMKYEKDNNYYIFDMVASVKDKTDKIFSVSKYNSRGEFLASNYKEENHLMNSFSPSQEEKEAKISSINVATNSINEAAYDKVYSMVKNNASNIDCVDKWQSYLSDAEIKINQNWKNQKTRTSGNIPTTVNLVLNSKGEVISKRIVKTSGSQIFDENILDYISSSSPFGKFPSGYNGDKVSINLTLVYLQWDYYKKEEMTISNKGILNYTMTKEKYGNFGKFIRSL